VTFAAETTQTNRTRREFNSFWRINLSIELIQIASNQLFSVSSSKCYQC